MEENIFNTIRNWTNKTEKINPRLSSTFKLLQMADNLGF